jgi:hypothetical protein
MRRQCDGKGLSGCQHDAKKCDKADGESADPHQIQGYGRSLTRGQYEVVVVQEDRAPQKAACLRRTTLTRLSISNLQRRTRPANSLSVRAHVPRNYYRPTYKLCRVSARRRRSWHSAHYETEATQTSTFSLHIVPHGS